MSFKSETYRVLIASPSDLEEERQAATEAVNDWNALNAAAEATVLLPVKWETHATPETSVRPQGAINRQLVAASDLLIGMFWTRIGTDTGVADSGTVEEIDQFVAAGKPAMLYFSGRPIDPNKVDLKQFKKLRQFKDETYKTALVGGFSSTSELRTKLLRDVTNNVRQMKGGKRTNRPDKIEQAAKLTELMLLHKQHEITPEQMNKYREMLGLKRQSSKKKLDSENPYRGLFFDYVGVASISINGNAPEEGWMCCVEIVGDNYETKKFEAISIAVNQSFATSEAAVRHAKKIFRLLGVECVDTRFDEL